jgi:hypothetical protein
MMQEPEDTLQMLLQGLDRLAICYMLCGSIASSVHGIWRATNDVDIVVQLASERIDEFVAEFARDFYVDKDQIAHALLERRVFNVVHLNGAYKFDLFPLTDDRFQQQQFVRGRADGVKVPVATSEDVILSKLVWYQKPGQLSDQHWQDILGVVAVQSESLDRAYLREWAGRLGVENLLEAALTERHGD